MAHQTTATAHQAHDEAMLHALAVAVIKTTRGISKAQRNRLIAELNERLEQL